MGNLAKKTSKCSRRSPLLALNSQEKPQIEGWRSLFILPSKAEVFKKLLRTSVIAIASKDV
ncbi:MAG: hypothetical protein N3E45_12040 [Oscillatoriaceae bacterium SKW80]|nr:hypothetical protein [Oscillatoriaceae bacterium SKYG93]MCX8121534.1 hypothetical protein [Oscillatoriaceae bacterium SKW80]MDW8452880.1 hypothetical protein [Oscillatoriaceae cyanobacterium SKYGB_i_bin93]HIK27879.1 hypothetical protein [Oscillatoriaceae cyanobacterium M7585_C2015_266]